MASCSGPYKQENGTYYVIWTDMDRVERRQIYETLKTKNKKTADRLKRNLEDRFFVDHTYNPWEEKWHEKSGTSLENPTIFEAVNEYISYKVHSKGADSWGDIHSKTGKSILTNFAKFIGKEKKLDHISSKDIENYLYKDGITSDHTRITYYRDIKAFLNWCKDEEYINSIPNFTPKSAQHQIPKFLTNNELVSICKYHLAELNKNIKKNYIQQDKTTYWMPLAWWLLARTGLRPGELMQLKTSHINLDYDEIIVGEDFTTKVRSQRKIPILSNARRILTLLLDDRYRQKDRYMKDSNWLFGRHGKQAQRRLSDKFRKARKSVLPERDLNMYNLKDTFCVWFLTRPSKKNIDHKLLELMNILGHSNLKTTQRYLKAVPYNTKL